MGDIFTDIRAPRLRVRLPAGGNVGQAITVMSGPLGSDLRAQDTIPCKDWSISDNCMSVSDAASFTVSNIDGENAGRFYIGQRAEIDESDPDVAGGAWCRQFTGRVTGIDYGSDIRGGSNVTVSCMDLGWHLTACHAKPLIKLTGTNLRGLIQKLVDPTWGFATTTLDGPTAAEVTIGNVLNRSLKQGRTGVTRQLLNNNLQFLPFIQVEPGQAPWEILQTYVKREGFLLNVGARGNIVLFQPDYTQESRYEPLEYHGANDRRRNTNNMIGRPTLHQSIEGIYSQTDCWSTVVNPLLNDQASKTFNPNAQYTRTAYKPDTNPLPFTRRNVVNDSEAINAQMRKNRAVFAQQMGQFNSYEYTTEVRRHSSGGAFYTSDSLQPVHDSIHGLDGAYYMQRVQRSVTIGGGVKAQLGLRLPGLLDPRLERQIGGGAKRKPPKAVP